MKKILKASGFVLATSFILANTAQALPSTKYTASCKLLAPKEGKYDNSKVPTITSQSAFKKLTAANQAYADGNFAEATTILKDIIATSGDSAAQARAHYILGLVYQQQDKLAQASAELQKALNTKMMGPQNEAGIKQALAYLAAGQGKDREALKWLQDYFTDVINPPASAYAALAQGYYKLDELQNSICPAYLALKEGSTAKKALYGMLFAAHYRLKDMNGSEVVAKEMINLFPEDKNTYSNLFAVYGQQQKEKDMLALAELAYLNGIWLSESNYKQLSALYANNDIPLLAAERLEEGMTKGIVKPTENLWSNVATNYSVAKEREKSIAAYGKASQYSDSGKYLYKIGNIYYDQEKYEQAISKYKEALDKGNLKDNEKGYSYLWMGISQFRLGQVSNAIASLNRAKSFKDTATNAGQFLNYVNDLERQRRAMQEVASTESE